MKENKIMVRNIERVETNGWKYRTVVYYHLLLAGGNSVYYHQLAPACSLHISG